MLMQSYIIFDNQSMEREMRKRKELKKTGRSLMRRNYISCVIISFIAIFIVSGTVSVSENFSTAMHAVTVVAEKLDIPQSKTLNKAVTNIKDFADKIANATTIGDRSHKGAISKIYKDSKKSGNLEMSMAEGLNNMVFGGKISNTIILGIGLVLMALMYIFVHGLFRIGIARFYLENRLYERTGPSKILFIYMVKRTMHSACIVFKKLLFLILWAFTIVGFPIKFYSYYMVSFIVAENPDIKIHDAMRLSMNMMKRHKWQVFKFDMTFLPWYILSVFTFGILQYLYVSPYFAASRAELYMELRKLAKEKNLPLSENFVDTYLEELPDEALLEKALAEEHDENLEDQEEQQYPGVLYPIKNVKIRPWLHYDYNVKYTIINLILMFFIFSMIGWVYETILESIKHGEFINRGSLYGPWVPIYGFGGIAVLMILKKVRDKPILVFFLSMLICGIIEYSGAVILEMTKHMKYWDYSGYFFNIQGRVCLEGLLVFAIGSCAAIYVLAPVLNNVLDKIPLPVRRILCTVLIAAFGADFVATRIHPHTGYGITYGGE